MRAGLYLAFAAAAFLTAVDAHAVELTLAHKPAAHEEVWLEIAVGALPRGAVVRIDKPDGALIETISPFAVRAGERAGTYRVPLPQGLAATGKVKVDLTVLGNGPPHHPTRDEVESVQLIYVPVSR
jgi:hypothetical protein